jgi:dipeptidyl aminopeptidase/acylaminoacyl peptidase
MSALRAACFTAALLATSAHARPFTAHDLVMLDRISDPHLSPDGARVVYDIRSTDLAANKGVHALWVMCANCAPGPASQPVRLAASAGGAMNPRWSPDGNAVYFLSSRSGTAQVWRTDLTASPAGASPTQVTNLPVPVGAFEIAPDGTNLVVSLAVFPDCETPACTKQRLDARKSQKASGQVFDKLFVRHWDEWADGTRNHLFALHLNAQGTASGAPVALMPHFDGDTPSKPFGDDADFAISPDSRTLIFSAREAGRTEPWSTNFDLYETSLDGSTPPKDLTSSNPAWDAAPAFSPDGKQLAYKAMKRPGFEADRFGIMIRDLATGATREVDPAWDRSADKLLWASTGQLLVTLMDHGHELLVSLDPISGAHTALTADGHVADVTEAAGRIVVARDSLAGPAELYRVENGGITALTHRAAEQLAGVQMAPYEQFGFSGWNNESVSGFVMKPYGFQAGKKYPVAFLVHGGPQSSFGDDWSFRWNPQFYAGAGFASVFIDFHGSTGYGQAFTDSISSHWGDRPLEDLQKGWSAALSKYPFLDGKRTCALGASYGGFMVYWMAGNWNAPFKCFVDHDGVFDNRVMGYATEELWFSEWENGHATPWEKPENYERFNPIDHVADWTKPMLVIHSALDYRIPLDQGLAAFTALQRKGVPSEFLTFPDENHWVLKPQNSLQWHATVLAWLKRWTSEP